MNLDEQFQAAVQQVNNLPGDVAAQHMTELYGLYKQATEGDHDTKGEVVGDDSPDNPSGTPGMSQAQWDSWSQFKGVPEEEAKRRYVQRAAEVTGGQDGAGSSVATDGLTNAPAAGAGPAPQVAPGENTTTARQPATGAGQSTAGGLRGDITAGAPYGGEDMLKGQQ
ncbi:hypothetical protein GCM10023185_16510 [Hymenobacter saemangeumensis]|uniref:ACB domain-containing protein n=1 Tax=Hymenobacter saemangeumensis TaxID=1084522 RepID=A0ABP8IAA1_9BACT